MPLEIEVSLGMRKYVVIITGDQGALPVFKRELGRYAVPVVEAGTSSDVSRGRRTAEDIVKEDKGKNIVYQGEDGSPSMEAATGSGRSRAESTASGMTRPERVSARARPRKFHVKLPEKVELCSLSGVDVGSRIVVKHCSHIDDDRPGTRVRPGGSSSQYGQRRETDGRS